MGSSLRYSTRNDQLGRQHGFAGSRLSCELYRISGNFWWALRTVLGFLRNLGIFGGIEPPKMRG